MVANRFPLSGDISPAGSAAGGTELTRYSLQTGDSARYQRWAAAVGGVQQRVTRYTTHCTVEGECGGRIVPWLGHSRSVLVTDWPARSNAGTGGSTGADNQPKLEENSVDPYSCSTTQYLLDQC